MAEHAQLVFRLNEPSRSSLLLRAATGIGRAGVKKGM